MYARNSDIIGRMSPRPAPWPSGDTAGGSFSPDLIPDGLKLVSGVRCRIPDDCMNAEHYPLFMVTAMLQE